MVSLAIVIGLVIAALIFVMGMDEDPSAWASADANKPGTERDATVEVE